MTRDRKKRKKKLMKNIELNWIEFKSIHINRVCMCHPVLISIVITVRETREKRATRSFSKSWNVIFFFIQFDSKYWFESRFGSNEMNCTFDMLFVAQEKVDYPTTILDTFYFRLFGFYHEFIFIDSPSSELSSSCLVPISGQFI